MADSKKKRKTVGDYFLEEGVQGRVFYHEFRGRDNLAFYSIDGFSDFNQDLKVTYIFMPERMKVRWGDNPNKKLPFSTAISHEEATPEEVQRAKESQLTQKAE